MKWVFLVLGALMAGVIGSILRPESMDYGTYLGVMVGAFLSLRFLVEGFRRD